MTDVAISAVELGKMYKLFRRPADKVLDALGVARLLFWRQAAYEEFWALRQLSLELRRGERVGIIGRNGSGKSTLLKIFTGGVAPTEGQFRVQGRVQALLDLGTGFHHEFTGRQNIRAALAYQGLRPAQVRAKEEEIVDFAELDEFIDQPVKTYSAGMYARLAFAAATAVEPEVLIIDEVLGAGDAYFTGKCVERMRRLTEGSGATVLFVSHDLSSVLQLCQRVLWIDRGRLRADGDPLEVTRAYSALMRREEEARLWARDLRVGRAQALSLSGGDPGRGDPVLFHLVPRAGGHPRHRHRVYRLRLLAAGDQEVGAIEVGGAQDNNAGEDHHILDSRGYMNWGPSRRDAHGFYRKFANYRGRYRHAPFVFLLPPGAARPGAPCTLEVTAAVTGEELVAEVYGPTGYREAGVLRPGAQPETYALTFDGGLMAKAGPGQQAAAAPGPGRDAQYGSGEARVTSVRLLDGLGQEVRAVAADSDLRVAVEFETSRPIQDPMVAFTVYLPDGRCALQVWNQDALGLCHGRTALEFTFAPLLLGAGDYVVSVGLFKYCNPDGSNSPPYHVLDRCIHFKVYEPRKQYARGLLRQPFSWRKCA
jgi:lipopolysaccharide transport system ATP-binding protein